MSNYEEAKKIYFKYNGNFFFMDREGDYEKYKSFNIAKDIEKQWDEEIKQNLMKKINEEKNFNMIRILISAFIDISLNTKNIEGLVYIKDFLLNKNTIFDTKTNMLIVGSIFKWGKHFKKLDLIITTNVMKEVLDILKGLLNKPITISEDYNNEDVNQTTLNDIKILLQNKIKEYTNSMTNQF